MAPADLVLGAIVAAIQALCTKAALKKEHAGIAVAHKLRRKREINSETIASCKSRNGMVY
ncbi:MAG: hypothetical protein J2P49_07045 [Methylocapsa sp.]|nr:hypothetical protein [Methylocapsa sp.]